MKSIDNISTGGGGGGILPHLIIISDHGSTVTVTKGSTVINAQETSSGHFECDVNSFGTWTIDAILDGDDARMNVVIDSVKVYTVDDSHWHADIIVKYPKETGVRVALSAAGQETQYAVEDPYTFTVHSAGTYTLTGTYTDGDITETWTDNVTVSTNGEVKNITFYPDPTSPTIPANDVLMWQLCAGDLTTHYHDLSDVLADSACLAELMSSENAVNYLVRSTSFITDICTNSYAMTCIGANNYASNTLLADSTWAQAICNSTYFESVLNVKVPTMTSMTTPSGTVFESGEHSGRSDPGWHAFDSNANTYWISAADTSNNYCGYDFGESVCLRKFYVSIVRGNQPPSRTISIQASNDNSSYITLDSFNYTASESRQTVEKIINNNNSYRYYRVFCAQSLSSVSSNYHIQFATIQFYCRENV